MLAVDAVSSNVILLVCILREPEHSTRADNEINMTQRVDGRQVMVTAPPAVAYVACAAWI